MVTKRKPEGTFLLACRALAVIAGEPTAVISSERVADRVGAHPVVLRRLLDAVTIGDLVRDPG